MYTNDSSDGWPAATLVPTAVAFQSRTNAGSSPAAGAAVRGAPAAGAAQVSASSATDPAIHRDMAILLRTAVRRTAPTLVSRGRRRNQGSPYTFDTRSDAYRCTRPARELTPSFG